MSLQSFFNPKGVALIGASNTPPKLGHTILKNLIDAGFPGKIIPVNPRNPEILGLKCAPSVHEINDFVDLAIVVVPARAVVEIVAECGKKGIRNVIIISGGFRETGAEGARLEQELRKAAWQWNIRVIGPNCQGVNSPPYHLCATWPVMTAQGWMAIISQSGTIAAAFADWASRDHLGISASVSMGNKLDVNEADLIEYFSEDPMTRVIALYLEGIADPPRLREVLQNCRKPVVILKSGRTPAGKKAAESHTNAMAGNDDVFGGLCKKYRIRRTATFEELYDVSKALAYLSRPRGKRIIFVTTSGGASILATDSAEMLDLDVVPLPNEILGKLREVAPVNSTFSNPLDLTGDGASAPLLKAVGNLVRPFCDTVGYVIGDPVEGLSEVVTPEDLVICLGGGGVEIEEVRKIHEKNIPAFPTPERGMKALRALIET